MPITARCPGCGKSIAGPDTAAGRKARCPDCGSIVEFPGARSPVSELAAAVTSVAASPPPARGAAAPAPAPAKPSAAAPPVPEPSPAPTDQQPTPATPTRNGTSKTRTTTVIDRLAAKTSPYTTLRLLAAVTFGVAVAVAAIAFLGGLAGLILVSMNGQPLIGVAAFAGGLVTALVLFLVGKTASEMLRLWADVGDRTRQMAQLFEEFLNQKREEPQP